MDRECSLVALKDLLVQGFIESAHLKSRPKASYLTPPSHKLCQALIFRLLFLTLLLTHWHCSATMAPPQIRTFFRFWFLWLDPIILVATVYALVFTPQVMLDALAPPSLSAYNPDQGFLLHQLAALYAFVAIILGGVLRISKDIHVWRVVILAVLVVDVAMLASNYASLKQQDRVSLGAMRSADWSSILFTGLVTAIRIVFLAGVGVRNVKSKKT